MSNGLGRGLGSLIPSKNIKVSASTPATALPTEMAGKVLNIEIDKIDLNPMQPRTKFADFELEELTNSIKEYGVIQPLIVSQKGGRFEIITGERRWRAAKLAGLKQVPIILRSANQQEKLEIALIENIQRENLNPIDLANAYKRLIDEFNITQEEVAKRLGKSRPAVTNTLRLLNLPEEIILALIDGRITEGHAKYLVGLDSVTKQMNLFRKILRSSLSVSDTSQEARRMGGTKAARIKINYKDKDKEFAFRQFFSAKVEIKRTGKGGQVIIDFYSDEELDEMAKKVRR